MAEVIVVGAGVVGTSVAFHLAERGVDALVVDRKGPPLAPRPAPGPSSAHYPTALKADLAWESLTEYFEPWGERIGGGFTRTGFAYLAGEERAKALRHNVALGRSVGVETELAGLRELEELDPVSIRAASRWRPTSPAAATPTPRPPRSVS